jgi:hypothetical protein
MTTGDACKFEIQGTPLDVAAHLFYSVDSCKVYCSFGTFEFLCILLLVVGHWRTGNSWL